MPDEKETLSLRERMARAICAAQGDDWYRDGPGGLMETYGPLADAAIAEMTKDCVPHGIKEALRPFASFAVGFVDNATWSCKEQKQSIKTWFGPSDFQMALDTYLEVFGTSGLEDDYEVFGDFANTSDMKGLQS